MIGKPRTFLEKYVVVSNYSDNWFAMFGTYKEAKEVVGRNPDTHVELWTYEEYEQFKGEWSHELISQAKVEEYPMYVYGYSEKDNSWHVGTYYHPGGFVFQSSHQSREEAIQRWRFLNGDDEADIAKARLNAAAPDLLAALEELVTGHSMKGAKAGRAAIAKAKGM